MSGPAAFPIGPLEFRGAAKEGLCWSGTTCILPHNPPLPAQGKFIRIHFGTTGKLAGADIESCESGPFWRVLVGRDQLHSV